MQKGPASLRRTSGRRLSSFRGRNHEAFGRQRQLPWRRLHHVTFAVCSHRGPCRPMVEILRAADSRTRDDFRPASFFATSASCPPRTRRNRRERPRQRPVFQNAPFPSISLSHDNDTDFNPFMPSRPSMTPNPNGGWTTLRLAPSLLQGNTVAIRSRNHDEIFREGSIPYLLPMPPVLSGYSTVRKGLS
jgi:hypothetical protein